MARLPVIGGDRDTWGTELNAFLDIEHGDGGFHNISYGNTASRPGSPEDGQIFINTQLGVIEQYQSTSWVELPNFNAEHNLAGTHADITANDITGDSLTLNQTTTSDIFDFQDGGTTVFKGEDGPVFFTSLNFIARGYYKNLVVQTNATNPTYQVDIDADVIVLESTTEPKLVMVTDVNLTADISAAAGINAKEDAGMETANEWVYVWVIYNESTGTTASVLSESSTWASVVKTNISGYNYAKLVSAIFNDSGSDFLAYYQKDNRMTFKPVQQAWNGVRQDGSWGEGSVSSWMSPITNRLAGFCSMTADDNTTTVYDYYCQLSANNNGDYQTTIVAGQLVQPNSSSFFAGTFEVEIPDPSTRVIGFITYDESGSIALSLWITSQWINI